MDLFEYQAKELFAKHNVPTTPGRVTDSPEDAKAIAEEIGKPVMVKAQVKVGGRGKAGGVKYAATPDDAYTHAKNILGMDIKGHIVKKLMVAEASDIAEEYYISFLLDRANRTYLAMCSVEGGVEIEELAADQARAAGQGRRSTPSRASTWPSPRIDRRAGPPARRGARRRRRDHPEAVGGLRRRGRHPGRGQPAGAHRPDDQILALDGKVTLDENADFRHPDHAEFEDKDATDPLELKAKENDLNYVKLDGEVGIIGNGAGLVMSTLDVVAYAGEKHGGVKPANFLDIGGGASAEVMAAGLDVILGDEQVKSVFVNVFGGITACDAVANGIVSALKILGDAANKPLVVRLDGNNVEEGRRILAEANHPLVTLAATMDEGADKAAELAQRSRGTQTNNVYFPEQGLQGHRPGHHRRRRHQAHRADAQGRHPGRRRRQRPQGRHHRHAHGQDGKTSSCRCSARVAEAMEETGADVSIVFVPPAFTKDAIIEAIDAEIPLLVVITEGIPVQDTADAGPTTSKVERRQQSPASSGRTAPASSPRVSRWSASRPNNITGKGPIGLVSKSGTLTYQMMYELRDLGFSTAIGIGGDPVIGTTHIDALEAFEKDPETKAIVMIGEIGGDAEERAADYIKANVSKPVVGYVAGFTAPEGKTMGHAGAIVSGSAGTAQAKKEALEAAGVKVGKTPSETADAGPGDPREPLVLGRADVKATRTPGRVGGFCVCSAGTG